MTELKPCPCCESENITLKTDIYGLCYVKCECGLCGPHTADGVSIWNVLRRVGDVDEENNDKPFVKHDDGKPQHSLLPVAALEQVTKVLMHGAAKYGRDNWRRCDDAKRYEDAALRHLFAHVGGEVTDAESGLPHLAHAACCVLFLLEMPIAITSLKPERSNEQA